MAKAATKQVQSRRKNSFPLFAGQTSLAATPDIYHIETSQSSRRNTKTSGRLFGNENGL